MGQVRFMGAILLAMLFATAVISYTVNFGNENEVYTALSNDSQVVQRNAAIKSNIETYKNDANSSTQALLNTVKEAGDSSPTSVGEFSGGSSSSFAGLKSIIETFNEKIFGEDQGGLGIFLTALISFLVLVFGLYLWKTLRGNPD